MDTEIDTQQLVPLSPKVLSSLLIFYESNSYSKVRDKHYMNILMEEKLIVASNKILTILGLSYIELFKQTLSNLNVTVGDSSSAVRTHYHLPLFIIYLLQSCTDEINEIFYIHSGDKEDLYKNGYILDVESCTITQKGFCELKRIGIAMEIDYSAAKVYETTTILMQRNSPLIKILISVDIGHLFPYNGNTYVNELKSMELLDKAIPQKITPYGKEVLICFYELRKFLLRKELNAVS